MPHRDTWGYALFLSVFCETLICSHLWPCQISGSLDKIFSLTGTDWVTVGDLVFCSLYGWPPIASHPVATTMVINSASKRDIRDFRGKLPKKKTFPFRHCPNYLSIPPPQGEHARKIRVIPRDFPQAKKGLVKITAVKTNNDNKFWNILD